ncbi:hypothetical protein FRC08_015777 [Ceratobasidium sp. 394]|nr:hypothetical protein FRC08_015777 [Ceratobasidium sp. 394]KAG9098571.1 hypothetical protein FS749_003514 [Ceratobasidium sp. UAMH 11750]
MFRRIHGRLTGANIRQTLFSVLKDFNILDKMQDGHVALDNASSNDTLMKELEDVFAQVVQSLIYDPTFSDFPHVANLSIVAILEALADTAERCREENEAKGYELNDTVFATPDWSRRQSFKVD